MKYIGQSNENYLNGGEYNILKIPMTGRRFKPGKGFDGKWLDTEGEKDNRVMVMKRSSRFDESAGYYVYADESEFSAHWEL